MLSRRECQRVMCLLLRLLDLVPLVDELLLVDRLADRLERGLLHGEAAADDFRQIRNLTPATVADLLAALERAAWDLMRDRLVGAGVEHESNVRGLHERIEVARPDGP